MVKGRLDSRETLSLNRGRDGEDRAGEAPFMRKDMLKQRNRKRNIVKQESPEQNEYSHATRPSYLEYSIIISVICNDTEETRQK